MGIEVQNQNNEHNTGDVSTVSNVLNLLHKTVNITKKSSQIIHLRP